MGSSRQEGIGGLLGEVQTMGVVGGAGTTHGWDRRGNCVPWVGWKAGAPTGEVGGQHDFYLKSEI